MLLNLAKFKDNGGSGYVLKPKYLMSDSEKPQKKTFRIKIISGQQFPKPPNSSKGEVVDPYIEIEVLAPEIEPMKVSLSSLPPLTFSTQIIIE